MSAAIGIEVLRDVLRRVVCGDAFTTAEVDDALREPKQPASLLFTSSAKLSDARINGRFVQGYRLSKAYRGFKENFAARVHDAARPPLLGPCIVSMALPWRRTCREEHNDGLPLGDVDSPVKCVLDALKLGKVFVDDSQVVTLIASKWPRPEQLIVEVTPCEL